MSDDANERLLALLRETGAGEATPRPLKPLAAPAAWPDATEPAARGEGGPGVDLIRETRELLDGCRSLLARFVRAPEAGLAVAAAWVLHAWAIGAADATPYLHVTGPTLRCGKTRFLEALGLLVPRPLVAANATVAALFRSLSADPPPTLILDEADAIFRRGREAREGAEDLRAMLNAGARRGTPVLRCVGQGAALTVARFHVFGAKALGGIGDLPPTLADRSLRIRMERLTPGERVERFLPQRPPAEAALLRERLAVWAEVAVPILRGARPAIPDALDDRAADACLALFTIADLAGEPWAGRIRDACVRLRQGDDSEPDAGARLLAALARIFEEHDHPAALGTAEIVAALAGDPDAPGGYDPDDLPRSGRRLAAALRRYGVRRRDVRIEGRVVKGYARVDLEPVIARYASPPHEKGDIGDNPHGYQENGGSERATSSPSVAHPDGPQTRMDTGLSPMSPIGVRGEGNGDRAGDLEGIFADALGPPEPGDDPPLAPGTPGFEGFVRRRFLEGHVTEAERDAAVALHRALRRVARAREAGEQPTAELRAELATALALAREATA